MLGMYVALGVNPSKSNPYPDKPFLSEQEPAKNKQVAVTDAQRLMIAKAKYGKKE